MLALRVKQTDFKIKIPNFIKWVKQPSLHERVIEWIADLIMLHELRIELWDTRDVIDGPEIICPVDR